MQRICVFGSFNYDMTARVEKFPQPGETLLGRGFETGIGGKGSNQAIAAHRAGGDVRFITKIGEDSFGRSALAAYKDEGMDKVFVLRDETLPSSSAFIVVNDKSGQNMIVVNQGACSRITGEDMDRVRPVIEASDILLIQLETNMDSVEAAVRLADKAGARVILNPAPAAPLADALYKQVDVITPNETEAELLTGVRLTDRESLRRAALTLSGKGVSQVIITLGGRGAYIFDGGRGELVEGFPVKAVDTTGAGDVFNGALAVALSEGRTIWQAAGFACAAGAIAVTRPGAAKAAPTRAEIDDFIRKNPRKRT